MATHHGHGSGWPSLLTFLACGAVLYVVLKILGVVP